MYKIYNRYPVTVSCSLLFLLVCSCQTKWSNHQTHVADYSAIEQETILEDGKGILQGNKFNKSWVMKAEAGAGFIGMYTDSSGKTYAINPYGIAYSCNADLVWKRESITEDHTQLTTVCGYGDDIYVAGHQSAFFHKKGSNNWVRDNPVKDSFHLTALYACENEVWVAAGFNGSIWHRNKAGTWEQQLTKSGPIYGLYGNGEEVWALSRSCVYHKLPGEGWKKVQITEKEVDFFTLYQYDKHIWIMGSDGNIFYNGGGEQWKKESSNKVNPDIFCSYGIKDEVYAAGKNGLILHRLPAGQWIKEEIGYLDFTTTCIYGQGQDIWIGGNDGLIFHKNWNGTWSKEAGPSKNNRINDISGHGPHIFAAGNYAMLLTRSSNNTWNKTPSLMPDTPLTSIFKLSKEILVGGKNGMLFHRLENGQWQLENSHAGDVAFSDLYETDKSIYLVGEKGSIVWRQKTDTVWKSQVVSSADLARIYGYGDDIWIIGHSSLVLHKKENEDTWHAINIGITEIDFMDLYGWNGNIWALGIKDQRGIIMHKGSDNKWLKQDIPNTDDHFHALYGRGDTIWAVGASSDVGNKSKTDDSYEGTIICKEGNSPWESQIEYLGGVHFNDINGQGNDVYALGNGGNVYHKNGNSEWEKEDSYHDADFLRKLFFFKGMVMLSNNGLLYRESKDKNHIRINRTGELVNAVSMDDHLYCIGKSAIHKIYPAQEKYPVIDKVRYRLTPLINPNSIALSFVLQRPKNLATNDVYQIEIYAKPYSEEYTGNKWVRPHVSPLKVKIDHNQNAVLVSTNIEVAQSLRVVPGLESANKISLRVDITTEDGNALEAFLLKDSNGNPYFTLYNDFWLENKVWIISVGVIVLYYFAWLLTWFFYPLIYLRVYHADVLQQLLSLQPRFHLIVGIINVLFPIKKLVTTARVQNTWVRAFAATAASKYDKSEITQMRSYYVSLPVHIDHPVTGTLLEKPDEGILDQLFNNDRSIIQIIGPGGSGKTSLAVAIGRWMIQSTRSRKAGWIPKLPILLETDSTDLLKEITGILRSWQNDYAIHEDFVKILLKNQRLVIIADSLSERPVAVQEYFKTLHGTIPVNALIITARQPVDLMVKEGIHLYPAPLDSNNLLHFITTYLNIYPNHPFRKSREQLTFAEKIVSIIEGNNNKAPVTPILVKLIIEIALTKEGNFQAILTEMPDSIPDVYYQYLAHVNPKNPVTPNYLPKQEMLQIAELLGSLSLGENFLPQNFPEEPARKAISHLYNNVSGDPIQRFIDNGILIRRESLATSYLRFNIDTLAEYLAASKLYDEHKTDPQQLLAFTARVNKLSNEAQEFKMAFAQIRDYKMKHG